MGAPSLSGPRCVSSILAKRLRVARLHSGGTLDPGAENQVVQSMVSLGMTPNVQAGDELSQRNGDGEVCAALTEPDVITRYDLTLTLCVLDFELLEILTGGRVLMTGGQPVGFAAPAFDDEKPIVVVEAWSQAQEGTVQATEDGAALWLHWVFPRVEWTLGNQTIERGILNFQLTGKAVENPSMGLGPNGEWPEVITEAWGVFLDDEIPDVVCGYQALVVAGSAS